MLFVDKKDMHVHLSYFTLLKDLTEISMYSLGSAILAHIYKELCQAHLDGATDIVGCITLLQVLLIFYIREQLSITLKVYHWYNNLVLFFI